ncbi:MAG: serine--tRNA ligase [Armatimonadetes bacterium]|nr:serine--tRNA ligase [Armatimonadota bacterium]
MLDRELIRKQPDLVRTGIQRKRLDSSIVDEFLSVDAEFRRIATETGNAQAEMNQVSKSIGMLMGQGKKDEAEAAKAKAGELKKRVGELEDQQREIEAKLHDVELQFPNLPHDSAPDGDDETQNPVIRDWGQKPSFEFEPKPHWDLADQHNMLDLARGAKITGSGWVVYRGVGAKLQRALFNFMVDHQTGANGYEEIYPPFVVNRESLIGTGNLPKFEDDLYKTQDDFFLIPTAEVPVTNLYRDEILDASQLPIKHAAFSGCFRREAGAAGKDTRGLLRIHQFDKVEMVKFVAPSTSYDELESLVKDAESILQALGLHYRVIELCTGDMGAKATKIYDLEVWAPGVQKYLEVSSCGNFGDYQARRANIRFRPEAGAKPEFVHILNGSGVAVPRLFAALMETYQQADGSVKIPPALAPYFGRDSI